MGHPLEAVQQHCAPSADSMCDTRAAIKGVRPAAAQWAKLKHRRGFQAESVPGAAPVLIFDVWKFEKVQQSNMLLRKFPFPGEGRGPSFLDMKSRNWTPAFAGEGQQPIKLAGGEWN